MCIHEKSLSICDVDTVSISVIEAKNRILESVKKINVTETVTVRSAFGRIASKNIVSQVNVPNHINAAMDGYAISGNELPSNLPKKFKVIGSSFAGKPFRGTVHSGECVQIMTGGVIPNGTDSVVIQERIKRNHDIITIQIGEKIGANVRYAGEDIKSGDVVIPSGTRLHASHLGLMASIGLAEVPVLRKPRVAFFSNGDELRSMGVPLKTGELYDSNRYTLYGMLSDMNVEMVDLGIIEDDIELISDALTNAAICSDIVITSAGASVGNADYIKKTLNDIGTLNFWKVAIKPGRPFAFGSVQESLVFVLPGNPVSVMVLFHLFVKQAISKMAGERYSIPIKFSVKTESNLNKRSGRVEYQRGILYLNSQGETVVGSTGDQGSGILSSMGIANCYIVLPAQSEEIKKGDFVEVEPFSQILGG